MLAARNLDRTSSSAFRAIFPSHAHMDAEAADEPRPDTQQHICVYAHVPMLARHFNGLAHDSAGSFRLRDRIVTRAQLSGIVVEVDKRGEKFTKISGHMHSC